MSRNVISDGAWVIVYEGPKSLKLVKVEQGKGFQNRYGYFGFDKLIGQPFGAKVFSNRNSYVYVLQPDAQLITQTLVHKTQILYQPDISLILTKLDMRPDSVVVEAGTGSGSLSCSIAQVVRQGHLFTFEFNRDRFEHAVALFAALGCGNVTVSHKNVIFEGFEVEGKLAPEKPCDCLFLDLPEPGKAIAAAAKVLRLNGKLCCFTPCIEQAQQACLQLRKQGFFGLATVEVLQRAYQRQKVQLLAAQDGVADGEFGVLDKEQKGHSGYLTFAIKGGGV